MLKFVYNIIKKSIYCMLALCAICGMKARGVDLLELWNSEKLWKMTPEALLNIIGKSSANPIGDHIICVHKSSVTREHVTLGTMETDSVFLYWKPEDGTDMPEGEAWRNMWADPKEKKTVGSNMRLVRISADLYASEDKDISDQDDKEVEKKMSEIRSIIMNETKLKKEKKKKLKSPNSRVVESRLYEGEKGAICLERAKLGKYTEYIRCQLVKDQNGFMYEKRETTKELRPKDCMKRLIKTDEGTVRLTRVPALVPSINSLLSVMTSQFSYYGIDDIENANRIRLFCEKNINDDGGNAWLKMGHTTRAVIEDKWRKTAHGNGSKDETMDAAPKHKVKAWWGVITSSINAGVPLIAYGEISAASWKNANFPKLLVSDTGHFQIIGYNLEKETLICMVPGDFAEREMPAKMVYDAVQELKAISIQGKMRHYKEPKPVGGASMFSM